MDLMLNDKEAKNLMKVLKMIVTNHKIKINENSNSKGKIQLESKENQFTLDYKYSPNSKTFNFRENKYNYTLLRINLNNNFHKNADKSIVRGNRINVFSTKEYIDKGDDKTYYKCFKLPYESIQNTDDFIDMLDYLWEYINVKNKNVFSINIQKSIL